MDYERQIVEAGVFNLENGIIAYFEVEDWLRNKSVADFSINRLSKEIRNIYDKRHPRY